MICDICGLNPCQTPGFCKSCRQQDAKDDPSVPVSLKDFLCYLPQHNYIFRPTGSHWPAASINGRLPPVAIGMDANGNTKYLKPSVWLDRNQAVEQVTWSPGDPALIEDHLINQGGWIKRKGARIFNYYVPPNLELGNADNAKLWREHAHYVYPEEAEHIIRCCAYRRQHPHIKINHALVLGGTHGIGKDALLAPVRVAIGYWNSRTVTPAQLMGRYGGFLKSVMLIVSEARDLGDVNRPQFYEHTKLFIASPPETILVDEKYTHEYVIPNLGWLVITTNHKAAGIYLPREDRRHFVAWSPREESDYTAGYFPDLFNFYENGGYADVAAYLDSLDVSDFDPKAPPPKTAAFYEIATASQPPEAIELINLLEELGMPWVVTLDMLEQKGNGYDPAQYPLGPPNDKGTSMSDVLLDRRNRKMIPRWMEFAGYVVVHNPSNRKEGLWTINKKKMMVYAKAELSPQQRLEAVWRATGKGV